jgi:hypothetical protein
MIARIIGSQNLQGGGRIDPGFSSTFLPAGVIPEPLESA